MQGGLLKKIIEATKELVETANWDCSSEGISLQAMDSSHVSLVSMLLRTDGFESLRCDKNINLGINMASMAKILKCAANDDVISLETREETDALTLKFESPSKCCSCHYTHTITFSFLAGTGKKKKKLVAVYTCTHRPSLPLVRYMWRTVSVSAVCICWCLAHPVRSGLGSTGGVSRCIHTTTMSNEPL